MRTILSFGFIFLYLLFGYIPLGIFWLYGKFINQEKADYIQLRMVQFVFKVLHVLAGIELTVIGEENVPKDEPVLYVANHRSMVDIVITYARCPRLTGFVAKDVVKKVPALRVWMRRLHCEFLDRKDIKEGLKIILSCIEKVKKGISIFIFPEGTRNKNKVKGKNVFIQSNSRTRNGSNYYRKNRKISRSRNRSLGNFTLFYWSYFSRNDASL